MDEIVVKYSVQLDQAEAELKGFEKELKSTDAIGKKTFSDITKEANKSAVAIDKTSKETQTLTNKLGNLADNLPFAAQAKQVLELSKNVVSLGQGAEKSSLGFRVLKIAIA